MYLYPTTAPKTDEDRMLNSVLRSLFFVHNAYPPATLPAFCAGILNGQMFFFYASAEQSAGYKNAHSKDT